MVLTIGPIIVNTVNLGELVGLSQSMLNASLNMLHQSYTCIAAGIRLCFS